MKLLTRILILAVCAFAGSPFAGGQVMLSPALQDAEPAETDQPATPTAPTELSEWQIYPAVEPDPALRFRLWPAAEQQTAQNAMAFVSRAILVLSQSVNSNNKSQQDFYENINAWLELPVDQLPREEVLAFLERYGQAPLRELARAESRMRFEYDLGINELTIPDVFNTLLPEIQEARKLARLLALRARLAIADGRWDELVADVRLGLRLSEISGRSTHFLVARLVGFWVAGQMLGVIETAVQQPDCPNLYWALASIPSRQLFEVRSSIEGELSLVSRLVGDPAEFDQTPIGAQAARARLLEIGTKVTQTMAARGGESMPAESARMLTGIYTVVAASPARELLATSTDWGARAYELSAPEAVLRAARLKVARIHDDVLKWALLPASVPVSAEATNDNAKDAAYDPITTMVNLLVPAIEAAEAAERRLENQFLWLGTVEAIRMHAAATGELPKSLAEMQPAPAWTRSGEGDQVLDYQRQSPTSATVTLSRSRASESKKKIQLRLQTPGES